MLDTIVAPNAMVTILPSHAQAEEGMARLRASGFEMGGLSVVARDRLPDKQAVAYCGPGGRARYWGRDARFWNGVWEALSGWAVFVVPNAHPILAGGRVGEWMAAAVRNSAVFGGMNALSAVLYGLGISKEAALRCEAAVEADNILLIVHGTANSVLKAADILDHHHPEGATDAATT